MSEMTESPHWRALAGHAAEMDDVHMRDLFAGDAGRAGRETLEADGLILDYSKNRTTRETWRHLLAFADARDLEGWRRRLFAGEEVNVTEGRAAFHMALRNRSDEPMSVGGRDVMPEVRSVLGAMLRFAAGVHAGTWRGATGRRIRHVVNIGIGGSHLGPEAAVEALEAYGRPDIAVHFVANVDGNELGAVLERIDPERTLFIVASKTFTTRETMTNAHSARDWLTEKLGEAAVARHFVAVSTNARAVAEFGIEPANMFRFWDWVGGRFSLWSAVGLPVLLAIGRHNFERLLAGAHAMDRHFRDAPLDHNMPVILGLLGVWYGSFLGAASRAVLPYDARLDRLVDHLQQLDMESNGKRVDRNGRVVDYATGAVLWGRAGTNGQHAFYQLLHQGTRLVPADILAVAEAAHDFDHHHPILLANALAQAEALMVGKSEEAARAEMTATGMDGETAQRLAPHRGFPGNAPTNMLMLPRLDPFHFGQLVALYEHRIFVEGVLWNINSFDQWGVELGKTLATAIEREIAGGAETGAHDASTSALVSRVRSMIGPRCRIARERVDAAIFDMDGVLTDSATLHAAAWKRLFDDFLKRHAGATGGAFSSFTDEDYRRHVAGKARIDGVRDFLAARGILLPEGDIGDDDAAETLWGLGHRKNHYFRAELAAHGAHPYPDARACLERLREAGLAIGVVSASRNARAVLDAAGLTDSVDLLIDGIAAAERDLPGTPAPDMLRAAARGLDVLPARTIVVEDSAAGVEAARAAEVAIVIGLARTGGRKLLSRAGADRVLASLDGLEIAAGQVSQAALSD